MATNSSRQAEGIQRKSVALSEEIVLQIEQWAADYDADFDLALEALVWGGLFEASEELLPLARSREGRETLAQVYDAIDKAFALPKGRRSPGY